jgi:endonuclease/exonuclease/phosphatase family metal-dependent hydrolase
MRVPRKKPAEIEDKTPKPRQSKSKASGNKLVGISVLLSFFTIGLYYACTIRPENYWLAGFSGFLIPPAIFSQVFLAAFWLWKKPINALIPGLSLVLGLRFIQASLGWHLIITEKCGDLKVLSLNAKAFGAMEHKENRDENLCIHMVENLKNSGADIICIQEMFDFPGRKPFNIVRSLKKAGYKHVFYSIAEKQWGSSVGMAILSRFPIDSKEIIRKKKGSNNQIIMARIRIGKEKLSIINMHLQSVAIKKDELEAPEENDKWLDRGFTLGRKLKRGFQARAIQIDELLKAADSEGNRVIICGDMNDTPYSNAYLRIRDSYRNSFEDKGRGLGFTFNGGIPFLRIDNQFYGKGLKVNRFTTNENFIGSDHYATEACYSFSD